jgi:hemerythrin-like domain-containing protein
MDGVSGENRLTASLRRDHEVILRALERLEERVAEWERTGKVDPAVLRKFVEFARTFVDRCHHGKEERCLFPCLERRGIPGEGGPIGVMLYEHQLGRELVARLDEELRALEGVRKVRSAPSFPRATSTSSYFETTSRRRTVCSFRWVNRSRRRWISQRSAAATRG